MRIRVRVRLDPLERSLVAGAARQEHCGVDPATLKAIGGRLGRQVLLRRGARPLALYTVTAENGLAGTRRCPGAVTVGPEGLARLFAGPPGSAPPPSTMARWTRGAARRPADPAAGAPVEFRATLDDEVTADIPEVVAKGRTALIEGVLGDATGGGGLAVLAPHGGMVEAGTDRQAERAHAAVAAAGRSARGWLCQGWKRGGGAKLCWHVTSPEISGRSFPKLGAMLAAKADHAVAFHGWTAERIGVGGGVVDRAAHPERHRRHEALKEEVRAAIKAALDALYNAVKNDTTFSPQQFATAAANAQKSF